jgi:hypothetical protein
MDEIFKRIKKNKKKNTLQCKKDWYKVGKRLLNGKKLKKKLHQETKTGARRTYKYYRINKGDWNGPSARQLSKMTEEKFEEELDKRDPLRTLTIEEICEQISFEEGEDLWSTLHQTSHVTESHDTETFRPTLQEIGELPDTDYPLSTLLSRTGDR